MRKVFFTLFMAAIFSVGSIGTARAELLNRGCGLIYDSDQDITWYDFTYVASNWADANAWADQLDYAGYSDWRLPTMPPSPSSITQTCLPDDGNDRGWNKTTSEMGHLFYVELANLGYYVPQATCDTVQDGWGLNNTGPFTNLQNDPSCAYWTDTAYSSHHWNFSFYSGGQGTAVDSACGYAIAVRTGDVAVTPPVANAGLDQVVFDKVTLDGGSSSDPGGTIISYQWNLQHWEDPAYNRTAEGVTPMVSNLEKGFYYVTLTVTSDNGCSTTDTVLLAAAGQCRGGGVVVPTFLLLGE